MPTGFSRALLLTLGAYCLAGCAPAEPAAAPVPNEAERAEQTRQIAKDERALQHRRLRLEHKVLAALLKLRDSRQASTGAAEPADDEEEDEQPTSTAGYEWQVFGGPNHEVFLGCLCDERRTDSVFNLMGEHGSDLSPVSIRNKFAPYGSNSDDTSACNAAATHPPVVLASDGKSLGLLTENPSLKRRISAPPVTDWLARMCGI
ncbi:MAG TPA: hypothetical protein VNG33_21140 [Polyangiaceae bacterium]|nr:hypothetical protein [Polyangiaceae bacterium]